MKRELTANSTAWLVALCIGLALGLVVHPSGASADGESETPKTPSGLSVAGGQLTLHGKFDIAYERGGYTDKITMGTDAVRNYHHFVFLDYQPTDHPFFFTAEIIDQYFYTAGARHKFEGTPWRVSGKLGKVMVPFGGEPLFHNTYGGLSGFDQQILPVVFSRHGVVGQVQYSRDMWRFTNEVYAVHGYELPASDEVLSLQTDLSSPDDARIAVGDRVGLGWGPFALWYSVLYNKLDFGRHLVMQGLDISLWRIAAVPVLEDIGLRAGLMRADVSGAGSGEDYYHFGDYLELRYYPVDWLYLRGRTGARTTDNRGGVYFDENREDQKDTSAHSVAVVYNENGWRAGLYYFWRTERVDERDNDLLRVRMGYEF